jgi:hypothetical protein
MAGTELYTTDLYTDANLEFYERFEGNADDSSSNSIVATPTNISYHADYGKFGQGARFNGSNSRIDKAYNAATQLGGQDFSIVFWIKRNADQFGTIIINRQTTGQSVDYYAVVSAVGIVDCRQLDGSTSKNIVTATDAIALDEYHHIAIIRDKGGTSAIYVDGISSGTVADDNGAYTNAANQAGTLGKDPPYAEYLSADLDDFAIFSRVLTPTEIQLLAIGSTTNIKTINGLAKASVKTVNGLAIASVKSFNGLE